MNRTRAGSPWWLVLGVLLASLAGGTAGAGEGTAATTNAPTVGREARLEVVLPGTRLEARPVTERAAVLVRIAEVFPHGTDWRYDLRYTGLKPGRHDLRECLQRADGSATSDLPPLPVEIRGVLPLRHDGRLAEALVPGPPRLGGYATLLKVLGALWLLGAIVWWRGRRRLRPPAPAPAAESAPGLLEQLQLLVERAAAGRLDAGEQARLERLLLGHWRERLELEGLPVPEAMARLRRHPEGGEVLRQLEAWLHRPPGGAAVDVAALLAPYRREPAGPGGHP